MPVENSKPNQHRWWGTLTIDPTTEFEVGSLIPKGANGEYPLCVYIKTTWESHTVNTGTEIKTVRVFSDLGKAKERFDSVSGLDKGDRDAIKDDLGRIEPVYHWCPLVEVIKFGDKSPLADELNKKTDELFRNEGWKTTHQGKIKKSEIDRALKIK